MENSNNKTPNNKYLTPGKSSSITLRECSRAWYVSVSEPAAWMIFETFVRPPGKGNLTQS